MLSTGLLADGPLEYADIFQRRWLVTAYDAGDVVLHSPFAVRTRPRRTFDYVLIETVDSCFNNQLRPKQYYSSRNRFEVR
jgi:hypothetical protein